MDKINTQNYKLVPILIISIGLLIGSLFSITAKAEATSSTQLAYGVGIQPYHDNAYHRPHHHRHNDLYWTGWRNVGHGCRKNCLVNRWNDRIIRCNRVCR